MQLRIAETVEAARAGLEQAIDKIAHHDNATGLDTFRRIVDPTFDHGKLISVVLSRLASKPDLGEVIQPIDWWYATPAENRTRMLDEVLDNLPEPTTECNAEDAALGLEYAALRPDAVTAIWITHPSHPAGKLAHDAVEAELQDAGVKTGLWIDVRQWLESPETTKGFRNTTLRAAAGVIRHANRTAAGSPADDHQGGSCQQPLGGSSQSQTQSTSSSSSTATS